MELEKSMDVDFTKSVYELQQMALDKEVDIEDLLRRAYLVAISSKQKDVEEWIFNEQNGYKNVESVPDYRYLRGDLKAYNFGRWIPMQFGKHEQAEMLSKMVFTQSISEIIEAYRNSSSGTVSYSIEDEWTQALNKNGSFKTIYSFFVSTGQLKQMLNSVQNEILRWTVQLEKSEWIAKEISENITKANLEEVKETEKMKKVEIFLSYCWDDSVEADKIYDYFKNKQNIELHREIFDIKKWGSIKEYMQSIGQMDYVILLISDSYLKSANCMYEVLEVMRDRNYKDKIFPAVLFSGIYSPITRAKYVKHWQDEFNVLEQSLKELSVQNLGKLHEDLKRRQDISSNIADFLDMVSDMNNPNIEDVCMRIEEKLKEQGLLVGDKKIGENDIFTSLGIQKTTFYSEPTDLEINQFVRDSFKQVVELLNQLCQQYQNVNSWVQIQIEQVDTRTVIYQFYNKGQLVKGLKLFLSSMLGSSRENIGVSDNTMSHGSGNSWNGMYDAKFVDGELKWYNMLSLFNNQKAMKTEDVVADIWKNYIQIYLD